MFNILLRKTSMTSNSTELLQQGPTAVMLTETEAFTTGWDEQCLVAEAPEAVEPGRDIPTAQKNELKRARL